jgi:hypothetical protein
MARGQVIEATETLVVDSSATNLLPLGGFVKGDPIRATGENTGREVVANTDIVRGFLINDQIFPYRGDKTLNIATKGDVEVTVSGAFAIDTVMILDATNPRRLTGATLNASGTTYRQSVGRLKTATTASGDKAILSINFEMITI